MVEKTGGPGENHDRWQVADKRYDIMFYQLQLAMKKYKIKK